MRVLAILLCLVALMASGPALADGGADDYALGHDAYEAGDYARARSLWQPLAEAGDVRAWYWMGDLYRFGNGVPQSFETALHWYTKAARQDRDPDIMRRAVYALGYLTEFGSGTTKDMRKAECLFRVSAENGYISGQLIVSDLAKTKDGFGESIDWVYRAAKQGNHQALNRLAFVKLMNPFGDEGEGFKYLILAAKYGSPEAQEILPAYREEPSVRETFAEGERRARAWKPVIEPIPNPPIPVPDDCWPG